MNVSIEHRRRTGIYLIENISNGKRYVGSAARCLYQRCHQHIHELKYNKHPNLHLQRSWNKHGASSFQFSILEEWEPELCVSMEQYWINWISPEYNINPVAGSRLGAKLRPETIAKMKRNKPSLETRKKISQTLMGHKVPREVIDKRREKLFKPIIDQHGNEYKSLTHAGELLGIDPRTILHNLKGRSKNPRHGYQFRYKEL